MLLLFIIFIIVLSTIAFMSKNENLAYVIIFLSVVLLKTYVDIYSLPDLRAYFSGYKELAQATLLQVPFKRLWTLKCPEIGFRYILKIGSILGSFRFSLFLIACINTFAYLNLIKKFSPYPLISTVIFLLTIIQSFFVIRQHCAIGIVLLSLPYILNRNLKMFLLCILLAFMCHQTALVFLPVYFIYGIKNKKRLIYTLALSFGFILAFVVIIFSFFVKNMVGYSGYENSNLSNSTTLLISLCFFVSYIIFLRRNILEEGILKLMFIILFLNSSIMLAGYQLTAINRLMMYYTTCTFISVPITAYFINDKLLKAFFLIAVIGIFSYMLLAGSNAEYLQGFKLNVAL